MGNRLAAFVGRPVRDFNIENRVERAIGVEKPKAAPRHPSDAKYERTKATTDTSAVKEKREDLLKRLRSVKVVSSSQAFAAFWTKTAHQLYGGRTVHLCTANPALDLSREVPLAEAFSSLDNGYGNAPWDASVDDFVGGCYVCGIPCDPELAYISVRHLYCVGMGAGTLADMKLMLFLLLQVQGTVPLKLDRPLPQSRAVPLIQKYGYFEPATIPRGRLTLRQATQMLADVKMDPGTFTAEAVAAQYSLDVRDVREVLHYFSIFRVHSIHLAQRDLTSIDDVKSELLSSRQDSQEGQISDAQNDDTEKKKV
ncbi:uncharacterized protein LOC119173540 isoform X2 [Rhipicephalus microplus]|uniref:uncharacterized protein LOC119173540 isoform X2 n=1 Tax=Rhipicephalus microplus TaxID=6941 RepID=UPI003F6D41C0